MALVPPSNRHKTSKNGTVSERFLALSKKSFSQQGKIFLNAYWARKFNSAPEDCEHIFQAFKTISNLCDEGFKGCDVKQWQAHQFLEKTDAAITWEKFKKKFSQMDLDFNDRLSLLEYLVFKFDGDIKFIVKNASLKMVPGIANVEEEIAKARDAFLHAKDVHTKIQAFKKRFNGISNKFQKIIDTESSIVKKNKAVADLRAHLSGSRARRKGITELDPEKLHTMEIDQGAALRKARRSLKKAEKLLDGASAGLGIMWWMHRELEDAKKSMSQAAFARKKKKLKKKLAPKKAPP